MKYLMISSICLLAINCGGEGNPARGSCSSYCETVVKKAEICVGATIADKDAAKIANECTDSAMSCGATPEQCNSGKDLVINASCPELEMLIVQIQNDPKRGAGCGM